MAQVWTDRERANTAVEEDQGPFDYEQDAPAIRTIPNGPRATSRGGLAASTTHRLVKRELYPIHIFFIVLSGTIGMGLFSNSGEILRIAGPVGGLIAYLVVGFCVICIMEGIAEMIGHWPIGNAFVEFVKAFVDKDLAIVIGLTYWYAYAISFATLIIAAANLAMYWNWWVILQDFVFIGGIPIALLIINCLGVFWYGNVEAVMGALKICLVIGTFILMLVINHKDAQGGTQDGQSHTMYLNQGFQHNDTVASSDAAALLATIPIIAYAYIGVEIVAVTALEANQPQKSLKWPAKSIGWVTACIYFFSVLSFYLNVGWTDPRLPNVLNRVANGTMTVAPLKTTTQSSAIAVIAVMSAGKKFLPGFLNACFIMAVLSASNTALYVASRTLFGLMREVDPKDKYWRWLSKLSTTTHNRRIPAAALCASVLAFCWVPFLRFWKSYNDQYIQEVMSGIATVGVVMTWGAQCLACIRYRIWLRRFKDTAHLLEDHPEYNHWLVNNKELPFTTVFSWAQPIPAVIGLIFCFLTVFVFATASWWSKKESRVEVYSAFVGPVILIVLWLFLKFRRWLRNGDFEWYVKLGSWDQLQTSLDRLTSAVVTDEAATTTNGTIEAQGAVFEREPIPSPADDAARDSGYVTPGAADALGVGIPVRGGLSPRQNFVQEIGSKTPSPMETNGGVRWDVPGKMATPSPNPSPRTNFADLHREDIRPAGGAESIELLPRRLVGQGQRQRMASESSRQQGLAGEDMERQWSGEGRGGRAVMGAQGRGQMFDDRFEPGIWAGLGSGGRGQGRGTGRGGRRGFI